MAQLDKEIFIEYIYWIFLVLIHFYSSFFINKTMLFIKARLFVLKHFYFQTKNLKEQQKIVKFAIENFNKK